MYTSLTTLFSTLLMLGLYSSASAQESQGMEKPFSASIGFGYAAAKVDHSNVAYTNAEFAPKIRAGFSYFASVDYAINERFQVGIGFNGTHSHAEFILNPSVGDEQVNGYLEKGNVSSTRTVLRLTYSSVKEGIRPFGRLAIGQFNEQAEMGDVPLKLTQNVETEMFPDFKYSGLGMLPEIGIHHKSFSFSVAYSLPFGELVGEEVPEGFESPGRMQTQCVQINACYCIDLF
ncbi:MAG: hypothetical protein HKN79_06750 [Flavobacteriales bacterium]|nr:hypothetical protein [Flavobacteriales bacterium]